MGTRKHITGIKRITDHVISKITAQGLDVYVSRSSHSKSRYVEVCLPKKKIIIRISDHPADRLLRWRYRFDIYTGKPRPGAICYTQFDELFPTEVQG